MALLSAEGLSKSYPGVHALTDVSFQLQPGEIHAVVGENGAGKSTLIKILTGAIAPDSGRVSLHSEPLPLGDALGMRRRGVSVVYQEFTLIPHLSVADNIFLGHELGGAFLARSAMRAKARALLEMLGVAVSPFARVSSLSVAQQQMVEMARALAFDAKVMVLDEPTATLSSSDAERLFATLKRLRQKGLGIIYISHRLNEIFAIADRVTVLRDGRLVATTPVGGLDRSHLIRSMVGREVAEEFPARVSTPGPILLDVRNAACLPRFSQASLSVRTGEIVGLAGLVGSGRTSLALALVGALRGQPTGEIHLDGVPAKFRSPADALAQGVAYVTEDRKQFGLFPLLATSANMTMSCLGNFARRGLLSLARETAAASRGAERFRLRADALTRPVMTLSGGNQQKALLARFLMASCRLVILDEPTRGVDVGARAEIYQLINQMAQQGLAILLISSDLAEIIGMSDRVYVMRDGRTRGVFDRADISPERVMALAAAG